MLVVATMIRSGVVVLSYEVAQQRQHGEGGEGYPRSKVVLCYLLFKLGYDLNEWG